jgi:hypothetical protein
MKNQILLSLFITILIFGCKNGKSVDDEVAAIKSATNYREETFDFPCTRIEYKLEGDKVKMMTASYGMGDGGTETEFYYNEDKLIFCKVTELGVNYVPKEDGNTERVNTTSDFNYYFENETITKCISGNKEIKLTDLKSYQEPIEILKISNQLVKAYSSKDSTVLCN